MTYSTDLYVIKRQDGRIALIGTKEECEKWLEAIGYGNLIVPNNFEYTKTRVFVKTEISIIDYCGYMWNNFVEKKQKQVENGM